MHKNRKYKLSGIVTLLMIIIHGLPGCAAPRDHIQPGHMPDNAIILYDGSNTSHWTHTDGRDVTWESVNHILTITPGSGSIITKDHYQNFRLHVEFRIPEPSDSDQGQNRGNSGVYLQRRYEVQILDSYGKTAGKTDCGALYNQRAPDETVCKKPGQWQTYDITFHAPVFNQTNKTHNAVITVYHNNTLTHDNVQLTNKTGAGQPEGPEPGPILLQDHGHPVSFRNIWIVPLTERSTK